MARPKGSKNRKAAPKKVTENKPAKNTTPPIKVPDYNQYLKAGYGSHMYPLAKCLDWVGNIKAGMNVLELGLGDNSTPLIIEKSKESTHYDNNKDWLGKFDLKGRTSGIITDWLSHDFKGGYDIALVDFAPGEPRGEVVNRLADKARIIIAHDTEETVEPAASNYGYDFKGFKYVYHFDKCRPHTTILSNTTDVSKIFE